MNEYQNIFSRHEIKYLVTEAQRRELERFIAGSMRPDKHGESTVCSLYLDTPDYRLIRRCLEKPQYKQKLRLRSYGSAERDDKVFLELKEKCRDLTYKRRIELSEREAWAFATEGAPLPEESQIGHELTYARSRLPGLAPAMYIAADRMAYFSRLPGEDIRVTFDRDILWRDTFLTLASDPDGEPLLPEGVSLVEVKVSAAVPLWLTRKLSVMELYPRGFSKYGSAYAAMLGKKKEAYRCA